MSVHSFYWENVIKSSPATWKFPIKSDRKHDVSECCRFSKCTKTFRSFVRQLQYLFQMNCCSNWLPRQRASIKLNHFSLLLFRLFAENHFITAFFTFIKQLKSLCNLVDGSLKIQQISGAICLHIIIDAINWKWKINTPDIFNQSFFSPRSLLADPLLSLRSLHSAILLE